MNRSLLSGRSQQRLVDLHRAANAAVHGLNQHHMLLLGALSGCDIATQRAMLEEYRSRAATTVEALSKLGTFLDHCRIAPELSETP